MLKVKFLVVGILLFSVLDFLAHLLESGCGFSAINTARSALSSIILVNSVPVGQHSLVKRFMRGVFNIKPSLPRYVHTWDVNVVLTYLKLWILLMLYL